MTQDPYTGEFKLNAQKASIVWNSFLRETKGAYASKGNLVKQIAPATKVIENECETITFYRDYKQEK